ncbi:MAG: hypothetical protein VCC99_00400 [Alphaproteobacteria bacterium]
MPNNLKFILSVVAALVAGAAYAYGVKGGLVILVLGAMMILGIWLFPETRREPDRDE